ncbi:MAG: diguanylate cyclase, partial [Rhodocyclaceae bacterium]|nr:diguanylate cyclase [Rhodocyclaceae bacterium]
MTHPVSWWRGIISRSVIVVLMSSLLMAIASAFFAEKIVGKRIHHQAESKLSELLHTVERTASIACFARDEQLAREVAEGLLRNSEVARVVIIADGRQLAMVERPTPAKTAEFAVFATVSRSLYSPFNGHEVIGEIRLDADWAEIGARVEENVQLARRLLLVELLLAVSATGGVLYFFVVRPIKAVSDQLHELRPTEGERLAIPPHHRHTEIGRLVRDIDQLIERLTNALTQERVLRQQREIDQRKYQNLFENSSSGIFLADRDGRLESYNRAFAELVHLSPVPDNVPRHISEGHWGEPTKVLTLIRQCLEGGIGTQMTGDFALHARRSTLRWLQLSLVTLGDGHVQGTVTDITERKQEELMARRLVVTDPLTGFLNRAGLQQALADLSPRSPPFALILIDLDGFKQINDALGFAAGDVVLTELAGRLRAFPEGRWPPARIGSDEFVVCTG